MEKKESDSSKRPLLAIPAKVGRKRRSQDENEEIKMKKDKLRAPVDIGSSTDWWRKLHEDLNLKSDAATADFFLTM